MHLLYEFVVNIVYLKYLTKISLVLPVDWILPFYHSATGQLNRIKW
ncbi:hypothetical protein HMPREF0454_01809 [Hafnia alvei ATCC 51873]|uniref:Uncharacterized protein n=1 Tax=Hafnia alvei ATCC 51873 TaxID=1002364 RepID=G9Y5K0_HAFAL|nr:hypothetical protein HMPREF0454_01809 [Hafnia alvei ATCC 51873]